MATPEPDSDLREALRSIFAELYEAIRRELEAERAS